MPVVSINIGPKRVHLTAYCPDDELGMLANDFVLARAAELLDGTSEAELRRWLIEREPANAELFAKLDAGWKLPKNGEFTVDPSDAPAEARIIRHLLRERIEQCAGRLADGLTMDAAGPIVAPAPKPTTGGRTSCCRNKDEPEGSSREQVDHAPGRVLGRRGADLKTDGGVGIPGCALELIRGARSPTAREACNAGGPAIGEDARGRSVVEHSLSGKATLVRGRRIRNNRHGDEPRQQLHVSATRRSRARST
jgi:hypothetical protein